METQENQENQEKDILSLMESSIKKGNENIRSFNSKLLSNIKKIDKLQNIKNIVEKNLSEKNIYFIRHAESEHNVLEQKYSFFESDKWNIYDPKLTEKGIEQTNSYTKEKLKKNKIHFDSVFVSPLTRTIQTYFLIEKDLNDDAKIIVTDFVKEVVSSGLDKNKGKKLSQLKEEYKNTKLNFEFMTKEYWWYNHGQDKGKEESEGNKSFSIRLSIFILWMAFRKEKNILIISHSHVFVNMQDSEGIYNGDMVKMDSKALFKKIIGLFKYYID